MFRIAQGISVFALAACGLGAQTVVTPPVQVTRTSGMVGIAEGQTARLNALNPGVAPPAAAGEICSGLLTFLGEDGKVLKSATVNVTRERASTFRSIRTRIWRSPWTRAKKYAPLLRFRPFRRRRQRPLRRGRRSAS